MTTSHLFWVNILSKLGILNLIGGIHKHLQQTSLVMVECLPVRVTNEARRPSSPILGSRAQAGKDSAARPGAEVGTTVTGWGETKLAQFADPVVLYKMGEFNKVTEYKTNVLKLDSVRSVIS